MKIENYDCEEEYDKLSKIYDKWASPTWPDDDNIQGLINFIKTFPGGRRILELGVGTGNVAIKLYMDGYHNITGTDKSTGMTNHIRNKCLKYLNAKPRAQLIKVLTEDIYETKYFGYDWILMVGSIHEQVENKKKFFQNMYNQMLGGALLFMSMGDFPEYRQNIDPNKDLYKQRFTLDESFNIEHRYRWYTPQHMSGLMTYTDVKTGDATNYKVCVWVIIQEDMIELLNNIGFKHLAIGKSADTGYYEDILVFQK